jgi:hypothetical protein
VTLAVHKLDSGESEVRFNTLRGLYYKVQSTTDLSLPFTDEPGDATVALNSSIARTNAVDTPQKFYRTGTSLTP